jgi:hypothetical protein
MMSAKYDSQLGLQATVSAALDQVLKACAHSAHVLGKGADVATSGNTVTITVLPGLVRVLSQASPVVNITATPTENGNVSVRAHIERYRTIQSRMFLIPIGPKRLVGNGSYLNLLTSLEQELRALDGGRGSVQRTGVR